MSESFDTRIARSVDARLASEDARECDGGCGSVGPNGGRCQGCDHGQYTRAPTEDAALPSPSGPSEDAREQGASAPCGTCGATPETGISEGCLECEGFAPPALPSLSGPSEGARSICVYCRRATPDGYDEHPECVERAAESGLAERSFDAQDGLLGGQVLGSSVTLGASHVPDESCDRPEVVRKFVGSGDAHAEDGLSPAPPLDDLRVTESLGGVFAGVPISSEAVGRSGDSGDDCFHNPIIPYVSSRWDAGPDAETLAAMTQTVQFSVSQDDDPVTRRAAREALSGLVALVEQLREECAVLRVGYDNYNAERKVWRDQAQAYGRALKEVKAAADEGVATGRAAQCIVVANIARAALAASAPGTEEPA